MPGKAFYKDCLGFDHSIKGWKYKYKQFRGHPLLLLPFGIKNVMMVNPFNTKFPKPVKNLRFRFMGAGQMTEGSNLQW